MPEVMEQEPHTVVRTRTSAKTIVVRIIVLGVLAALAIGGYLYWKDLAKYESTDDAQVDGQIYPVSARITGHVAVVNIEDHQFVNAGDVLVQLDPKDYEVAITKAKADLADAMAGLQSSRTDVPITSVTTASTLSGARSSHEDATLGVSFAERQLGVERAKLATARSNVRVAEANYARTAQDVQRYKQLVDKDEISKQQYDQSVSTADAARATLDAQKDAVFEAEQNIAVAEKAVEQARMKVETAQATVQSAMTGPQQVRVTEARAESAQAKVEQQRAALEQAELNLSYTTIIAPVSGIVGKKAVTVGQNLSPGQEFLVIVPVEGLWVTANFKETQLKDMRVGQPVKIRVDAYGRDYTGKVLRVAGASGSRFSLLPPENATGNYVKVVQRIPVRIAFDPGQNGDHLLRPGMSVVPTVTVH
ncbi:MAG: HlyD family secretion protein [Bryobacteraceae bacterium]|jgi:membrane fusion protein (multidrug efflux system)